jgi:hypothetical protein
MRPKRRDPFVRVDTRSGEQLASARARVEQEAQNEMAVCRANNRDGVSLDQGPFERADEAVAEGSRGAERLRSRSDWPSAARQVVSRWRAAMAHIGDNPAGPPSSLSPLRRYDTVGVGRSRSRASP